MGDQVEVEPPCVEERAAGSRGSRPLDGRSQLLGEGGAPPLVHGAEAHPVAARGEGAGHQAPALGAVGNRGERAFDARRHLEPGLEQTLEQPRVVEGGGGELRCAPALLGRQGGPELEIGGGEEALALAPVGRDSRSGHERRLPSLVVEEEALVAGERPAEVGGGAGRGGRLPRSRPPPPDVRGDPAGVLEALDRAGVGAFLGRRGERRAGDGEAGTCGVGGATEALRGERRGELECRRLGDRGAAFLVRGEMVRRGTRRRRQGDEHEQRGAAAVVERDSWHAGGCYRIAFVSPHRRQRLAALSWTLLVVVALSVPLPQGPPGGLLDELGADKWVHVALFAVHAALVAAASRASAGRAALAGAALAALLGALGELWQGLLPWREAEAWDLVADVVGAAAGALLWRAGAARRARRDLEPERLG